MADNIITVLITSESVAANLAPCLTVYMLYAHYAATWSKPLPIYSESSP